MHPIYRSILRPVAQGIEGTCPSVRKRPHVPKDNRLRTVDGCPIGGLILDDLRLHPIAYARRFRGVQPRLLGGADLADFALVRLTGRRHTILPRSRRARAEGPIPGGVLLSLLCAEPFCWSFDCRSRRGRRLLVAPAPFTGSLVASDPLVGHAIGRRPEPSGQPDRRPHVALQPHRMLPRHFGSRPQLGVHLVARRHGQGGVARANCGSRSLCVPELAGDAVTPAARRARDRSQLLGEAGALFSALDRGGCRCLPTSLLSSTLAIYRR